MPVVCPACGENISKRFVMGRDAYCPACHVGLTIRVGPFRALPLFAAVIVSLVGYGAGLRGDALFAVVCLVSLPVAFVMAMITVRLFPPELEATGDYRGILHPVEDVPQSEEPDAVEAHEATPDEGLFHVLDVPRTLEGLALRVGFGVLFIWMIWMALEPLVYRVFPSLGGP
jgi:hypothetical protein